jgi:hypothetical protein
VVKSAHPHSVHIAGLVEQDVLDCAGQFDLASVKQ